MNGTIDSPHEDRVAMRTGAAGLRGVCTQEGPTPHLAASRARAGARGDTISPGGVGKTLW